MAAPTEGQNVKKPLANGEPSTHGAKRTSLERRQLALKSRPRPTQERAGTGYS